MVHPQIRHIILRKVKRIVVGDPCIEWKKIYWQFFFGIHKVELIYLPVNALNTLLNGKSIIFVFWSYQQNMGCLFRGLGRIRKNLSNWGHFVITYLMLSTILCVVNLHKWRNSCLVMLHLCQKSMLNQYVSNQQHNEFVTFAPIALPI